MLVNHKQTEKSFHMDAKLHENLMAIRKIVVKKDFDWPFLVCGKEGFGKSLLAQQLGYVCANGELEQEDVCFTFNEFYKRVY